MFDSRCRPLLAGAATLLLAAAAAAQEPIVSTFVGDDEGWAASGGTLSYQASAGNPGGYVEFEDLETGLGFVVAPSAFLGDLSAYDGGSLKFDLKNTLDNGEVMLEAFGWVSIESGAIAIDLDVTPRAFLEDWTTVTVPLTADAWEQLPEDWALLLANVTAIRIYIDAQDGTGDRVGVDNCRMAPAGTVPVEPQRWGTLKQSYAP